MKVKFKKLSPDAIMPKKASLGSAAFDLRAASMDFTPYGVVIGTGLSFEIPEGHVMMIYSRSGQGFKHGVRLANGTGVIDSDYRGEVMVKLTYGDSNAYGEYIQHIKVGDSIAQAIIMPIPDVEFVEAEMLSATVRGTSGLGSTGNR